MSQETKREIRPLSELAEEFINDMVALKSGSKDMDAFWDQIVKKEEEGEVSEAMEKEIHEMGPAKYDLSDIHLLKDLNVNVSEHVLAWFCIQSRGNPKMAETMLGYYAVYFYARHHFTERLTLKWIGETVGKGKLINFQMVFPWYAVTRNEKGDFRFETITREELYSYAG